MIGQQLDVGEPVGEHVVGQRVGDLVVAHEAVARREVTTPGPEVDLVDRDRRVRADRRPPAGHPCGVLPVVVEGGDHRRRRRRLVRGRPDGVRLLRPLAVVAGDRVPVRLPDERAGDVRRPDAGLPDGLEPVTGPAVEIAEDVDRRRVRGPHGEPRACGVRVGAQAVVQVTVGALVEQVQIDVAERVGRRHGASLPGRSRVLRSLSRRRTSPSASMPDVGRRSRRRQVDSSTTPGTLCGATSPTRSSTSARTR